MQQHLVTIGVGGVLHDFAVAVCVGRHLAGIATAAEVTGAAHGVDVDAMQRIFDSEAPDRAIGRWLRSLERTHVVEHTMVAALELAHCEATAVTAAGFCCPDVLIPQRFRSGPKWIRVNHLDAHVAGVAEAIPGDFVFVMDGLGDRGPNGKHEASALYWIDQHFQRLWTIYEPASLGILLDSANLLLGQAALERPLGHSAAAICCLSDDEWVETGLRRLLRGQYAFDGLFWKEMVSREAREAYLERISGDQSEQARQQFALRALMLSKAVVKHVAQWTREHGRGHLWLAGEAAMHINKDAWSLESDIHLSGRLGDDGVAFGAARLALRAIEGVRQEKRYHDEYER